MRAMAVTKGRNDMYDYPMGRHPGGHGMSHAEKEPKGHLAGRGFENLKSSHLERAARIHGMQASKMGPHGVLVESSPENIHMNLEHAYKVHAEGGEMSHVLQAMSTPHELKELHMARREEVNAQQTSPADKGGRLKVPSEVYNEII